MRVYEVAANIIPFGSYHFEEKIEVYDILAAPAIWDHNFGGLFRSCMHLKNCEQLQG